MGRVLVLVGALLGFLDEGLGQSLGDFDGIEG